MWQQHTTGYYRCTAGLYETLTWFAYITIPASLTEKNLWLIAWCEWQDSNLLSPEAMVLQTIAIHRHRSTHIGVKAGIEP